MGAFSGVVAADQGNISFDSSTYTDGDVVTVTVEDSDLSTTTDYVVNIESDTESQQNLMDRDIVDGTDSITTEFPVADYYTDNQITKTDFVYSNQGDGSGGIATVSRNRNGTVDLELLSPSDKNDRITYTRGETVLLTSEAGDQFFFFQAEDGIRDRCV